MKTVTRKTHTAFIATLSNGLKKLNAVITPCPWDKHTLQYRIESIGLTLSPDTEHVQPGDRWNCKSLDCFGRFDDPAMVPAEYGKSYTGKWNFHFGYVADGDGAGIAAESILYYVRRIIGSRPAPLEHCPAFSRE